MFFQQILLQFEEIDHPPQLLSLIGEHFGVR
jgi:hypothetical protein